MHSVAIIGGTGYTGYELMRILVRHPHIKLGQVVSRSKAGCAIAEVFPKMKGHTDLCYTQSFGPQDGGRLLLFTNLTEDLIVVIAQFFGVRSQRI